MEFKFRAVDKRESEAATSYPVPSIITTTSYVSQRSLGGEALRRREMEKEAIRREMIAMRKELEDEVRRELAMERALAIRMGMHGFSFLNRMPVPVTLCSDPLQSQHHHHIHNHHDHDHMIMKLPQPQPAEEIKPPNKDIIIPLAKPDPYLYGAKRKASSVSDREHSTFSLKKKPNEEWSCALCQVSATNERGLNEHLHGRKHKAKEAALRTQKISESTGTSFSSKKSKQNMEFIETIVTTTSGLGAKADRQSLQPCTTRVDINQTMVNEGVVESKNEEQHVQKSQKINEEAGTINASTRTKIDFWCEICKITTYSQIAMESHKKGKKHQRRMNKLTQNNGSAPPTSSVSQEAPGLIQDIDVVNKETDQKITPAMNEVITVKIVESFSSSDEVHSVAESREDRAGEGQQ